jgi:hypothetical protein
VYADLFGDFVSRVGPHCAYTCSAIVLSCQRRRATIFVAMASRQRAAWASSWLDLFQRVDRQSDWEPEEPIAIGFLQDPEQSLIDPRVKAFLLRRHDGLHTLAVLKRDLKRLPEFHALKGNSRDIIEHLAYLLLAARIASEKAMALSDYSNPRGLDGKRHKGKRLDRVTILFEKRKGTRVIASKRIKLPLWAKPPKALLIDAKKLRNHALWTAADYLKRRLRLGPESAIRMGVAALNLVGLGVAPVKFAGPDVADTSVASIRASGYGVAKRSQADAATLESLILKTEIEARLLASNAGWDLAKARKMNQTKLQTLRQEILAYEKQTQGQGGQANELRDLKARCARREGAEFLTLVGAVIQEHRQMEGLIDQDRRRRRTFRPAKH